MQLINNLIVALVLGVPLGFVLILLLGVGSVFTVPLTVLVIWMILSSTFTSKKISKNFARNVVIGIIVFFVFAFVVVEAFGFYSITHFIQCLKYC